MKKLRLRYDKINKRAFSQLVLMQVAHRVTAVARLLALVLPHRPLVPLQLHLVLPALVALDISPSIATAASPLGPPAFEHRPKHKHTADQADPDAIDVPDRLLARGPRAVQLHAQMHLRKPGRQDNVSPSTVHPGRDGRVVGVVGGRVKGVEDIDSDGDLQDHGDDDHEAQQGVVRGREVVLVHGGLGGGDDDEDKGNEGGAEASDLEGAVPSEYVLLVAKEPGYAGTDRQDQQEHECHHYTWDVL